MKHHTLVASVLFVLVSLGITRAHAQSLELVLTDPDQTVTQGTATVAFDATVSNPTTDTIYLNGDASATDSPYLSVDDSPFFANAPISLAPGASSGPFELFDVDLAANTPVGTYTSNTFSILGGADGGTLSDFFDLGDADFSITVDPATATMAPEIDPEGAFTALTLLAGCLLVLRGRRVRGAT
jgi:hypothetical protein